MQSSNLSSIFRHQNFKIFVVAYLNVSYYCFVVVGKYGRLRGKYFVFFFREQGLLNMVASGADDEFQVCH